MRFVPWLWGESISRNYFKSTEKPVPSGFSRTRHRPRERDASRSLFTKSISFPAEPTPRLLKWFEDGFASRKPTWAGWCTKAGWCMKEGPRV
jgi:hypothetical protein